jgi:hypothetical protein
MNRSNPRSTASLEQAELMTPVPPMKRIFMGVSPLKMDDW